MSPPTLAHAGEATPTDGRPVADLDLARMRRHRQLRLRAEMGRQGVDALLLFGGGAVEYATGAARAAGDAARAALRPTAALVVAGDALPHLLTPYPEGAPPELPADHVHPAPYVASDDGVRTLAAAVADLAGGRPGRLAVDDMSGALHRLAPTVLAGVELLDAGAVLGPARVAKSPDELECIRRAQRCNELAMYDVQGALRPGLRQSDLTAIFLERIFELGATANGIDPIWQVMAPSIAAGPATTSGEVAFPLTTTDRILAEGDLVWVDTGVHYHGYASDFGRTWLVGRRPRPTERQRSHCRRWLDVVAATLEVVRAGATGADLTAAARSVEDGRVPWLGHFYLAHGLGTESAEAPMIGSDMGAGHDAGLVLAPGMVLVLEPVIWDDGFGGYRAEDIVSVTEEGYVPLSDHPYDPFDRGDR